MSETEIEPHVVDPASLTDEDLMRDVACFSSAFEHGHEQCKQCHVRDRCVTRMAKVVIPDRIVEMGGPDKRDVDWTLDDLAMMLGSDTKSVQLVMEIGRGRKIREVLGPSAADAEDEPAPPPEPEPPVAEVIEKIIVDDTEIKQITNAGGLTHGSVFEVREIWELSSEINSLSF